MGRAQRGDGSPLSAFNPCLFGCFFESIAEADADIPCHLDHGVIRGQKLCAAGGVLQGDGDDLSVLDGHHAAVLVQLDQLRRGGAELGINDVEYDGASNDSVLIFHEPHPNGQRIQEALGLDDVIFDIELTPNRPDCQSIIGICREAASALEQKFIEPEIE